MGVLPRVHFLKFSVVLSGGKTICRMQIRLEAQKTVLNTDLFCQHAELCDVGASRVEGEGVEKVRCSITRAAIRYHMRTIRYDILGCIYIYIIHTSKPYILLLAFTYYVIRYAKFNMYTENLI